jgi:hypothetical protein
MRDIDYLSESRDLFDRRLLARFDNPIGATEHEVSELEGVLGFRFPIAYRQYLLWMGKDKHGALKGSEWFIDDVEDNQDFLEEFLNENSVTSELDRRKFCIFSHQGYMGAWFLAGESEADPKCQFYSESNSDPIATDAGTFSQFLLKELQGIAEILDPD